MKTSAFLSVALAALLPGAVLAKTPARRGKGLPPKFGGLIKPAPEVPPLPPGKLITSELAGADLEFLLTALELGHVQAWLLSTAQEKADSAEMRAIGGALGDLQMQENKLVAKLAASRGVVVPADEARRRKIAERINSLSGPRLEKALLGEIVAAAEQSVDVYASAIGSKDSELKQLAEQMLPAAKSRLQFANKASGRAQDTSARPAFRTAKPEAPRTTPAPSPAGGSAPASAPATQLPPRSATPAPKPSPPGSYPTPPPKPPGPKPVQIGTVPQATPEPPRK